jgi:hypothetical protein
VRSRILFVLLLLSAGLVPAGAAPVLQPNIGCLSITDATPGDT